jgi:hypothetical protein
MGGYVGSVDPDISKKYEMGHMRKGVANAL